MLNTIRNAGAAIDAWYNKKTEIKLQDANLHQAGAIDALAKQQETAITNGSRPPGGKPDTLGPRASLLGAPLLTPMPQAHVSNVAHSVPGMNLSGPTGQVANMAFQAGAEGTQMAETGMTAGMGQLGQVMTLGIKQQVEMALMKQATDIAGAVAKELRNVSKNVKDMAGS